MKSDDEQKFPMCCKGSQYWTGVGWYKSLENFQRNGQPLLQDESHKLQKGMLNVYNWDDWMIWKRLPETTGSKLSKTEQIRKKAYVLQWKIEGYEQKMVSCV